jgi:hypothetical protein
VLKEPCRAFREEFMPGQTGEHGGECLECRQWAEDIERLRGLGANLPLPGALRSRLKAVPANLGQKDPWPVAGMLPQVPLPAGLMATLYRIPAESHVRRAPHLGLARTGETVAASLLFAALLTLGLGGKALSDGGSLPPDLPVVSRMAARALRQAGDRGNQTLLGAGESIVRGCILANRSLENLIERFGTPKSQSSESSRPPSAAPCIPSQPSHPENKENPHGSLPAR